MGFAVAVLIAGLGYIGSALAARLLAAGEDVVAIENFFSTPESPVRALTENPGLRLIEGSILDTRAVDQALTGRRIDIVFHLAAQASAQPTAASIDDTCDVNFEGTRRLLAACRDAGVPRMVLASSMRLYATPLPRRVTERSPIYATDLVHLSQLFGEVLLSEYQRRGEAPWRAAAARLGIVHGVSPVMKQNPAFLAVPQRFCWQAARGEPLTVATGPDTVLAFVHVEDVVDTLLRCGETEPPFTVANVATEVSSVAEVAEIVRQQATRRGLPVRTEPDLPAPSRRAVQVESVLGRLRAASSRRLAASLGAVLDYYLANPSPTPPEAA